MEMQRGELQELVQKGAQEKGSKMSINSSDTDWKEWKLTDSKIS